MSGVKTTAKPQPGATRRKAPAAGRSLTEKFPKIAAEWDADGNGALRPEDVSYGSDLMASWLCPAGHGPYLRKISLRTGRNRGCPVCAKATLLRPRNGKTLAEAFPKVAADWDYEANHPLTPSDVAARSNRKAFFICPKGHGSTESYISNRTAGNGCPECGKQRQSAAQSARAVAKATLAGAKPELAAEWNRDLNELTPDEVSPSSLVQAWWNCPVGHEPYKAAVGRRTVGRGCPECARTNRAEAIRYKGPKPGTSLADKRPDLIPEWDTERNTITPADVAPNSRKVVHWICPDGHRYESSVVRRTATTTCPVERAERRDARVAPQNDA
ncbi:zinc-ribbon domain-containing protein [Arthrobacter sp. UYCo732]|uniref:zinc-ribbon domain-containing protein n=1 Tax=Arthrobacter sp. UYCo732 TaxID=3156336 RepID=UPI0033971F7C